jgi:hypothetical protein
MKTGKRKSCVVYELVKDCHYKILYKIKKNNDIYTI